MDILAKLFGSSQRVRLLRLFILNPDSVFLPKEIVSRTRVKAPIVRRECALLKSLGLLRSAGKGVQLHSKFPLIDPLKRLLIAGSPVTPAEVVKRLDAVAKLKLVVLSGVFLPEAGSSRADLLLVGEKIHRATFENMLRSLEADLGKELKYAVFETADFNYRRSIFDKFILDILDAPHVTPLDKIGV